MDGRHGTAGRGFHRPAGLAARLMTRYTQTTDGLSGVTALAAQVDLVLLTGDGFGRLAHPLLGIAPAIESARVLKVELRDAGEVRARLV